MPAYVRPGDLLSYGAVAEAAAVGSPDEGRGQIVKIYVILSEGNDLSNDVKEAIRIK